MDRSRPPRAFLVFLAVALLQLGLFVLVAHMRVVIGAAAVQAFILWRLARGGQIAWVLLLIECLWMVVPVLAIGSSGLIWGNVAVLVIPSLVMLWLLVSAPMRRHVGLARPRPAH